MAGAHSNGEDSSPAILLQPMAASSASEQPRRSPSVSNGSVTRRSSAGDGVLSPDGAVTAVQQWNKPRLNMWRVFATFGSFALMGANDAAYGVSHTWHCMIEVGTIETPANTALPGRNSIRTMSVTAGLHLPRRSYSADCPPAPCHHL
jgi:hypothetical protein